MLSISNMHMHKYMLANTHPPQWSLIGLLSEKYKPHITITSLYLHEQVKGVRPTHHHTKGRLLHAREYMSCQGQQFSNTLNITAFLSLFTQC